MKRSICLAMMLLAASFVGCKKEKQPSGDNKDKAPAAKDQGGNVPASKDTQEKDAHGKSSGEGDKIAYTHELASDQQYYLTGPQQMSAPDGTMKAGTKVKLIEEAGSYSRVQSDEVTAFVSTGALKPLKGEGSP